MSDEVKSPNYWKSLNELAKNEEYKKYTENEFPENATELKDQVSRRSFLRVMGASIALAGFASCRRPVQKILPYTEQPEDVIPGTPLYYASAMPFQGNLSGIVVENHEGRPTKIEGNKLHPDSVGSTNKFQQAAVLQLYDPDRSKYVRHNGERSSYSSFQSFAKDYFADTNKTVAFVSEANSSPTYNRLKEQALEKFSNARWITYEPFGEDNALEGANLAFGQRLRPIKHFDETSVIVSFEDDFLNASENPNNVRDTKLFSQARRVSSTEDDMSRLYAIESTYSLTGSKADNRLRIKTSEIELFIYALAARLADKLNELSSFANYSNKFSGHEWIEALAEDLLANQGTSLLTVGRGHKPEIHATIAALNSALDNIGTTVTYHQVPFIDDQDNRQALVDLVDDLNNGTIDTVVFTGTNPAFTAPSDLNLGEALQNANQVITLGSYVNETSELSDWHINRAHFLEAWGDGYSYTGTRSIIQPQIEPLYSGVSEVEFLYTIVTGETAKGYDLVRQTWREFYSSNFQSHWEKILHDGLDSQDNFPTVQVSLTQNFERNARQFANEAVEPQGMELVIQPDSTIFDGRFANNGWLQELPDPMTKITWDNVALMSRKTADKLGVQAPGLGENQVDIISITAGDAQVEIPAWILPGHADDSITVAVGYGRDDIGNVANGAGVNTYPLRTSTTMLFTTNVKVESTDQTYDIACTQDHNSMEGRSILRHATLAEYRENPDFSSYLESYDAELPGQSYAEEQGHDAALSIFDAITKGDYPDYEPQWGMAIDLNACVGCGTCTIACQAENNIPVIGKREVSRGREMHWIRTDRYFEGDADDPQAMHQPVPCMHCELAPCEQVCPVAATTHSDDGLNQMTYNRCIGTRYCNNNCPYKVRRFNFFNYSKEFLTSGDDPEIVQMAMNPDVTIRFRGVMEKCTYCVQRITQGKIQAQLDSDGATKKPEEGAVKTACQQACPANAIYFGDLTKEDSEIVRIKKNNRNYLLLEELNTRPRTSYLAELRNPNPQLA